jgi:hypothetical protein
MKVTDWWAAGLVFLLACESNGHEQRVRSAIRDSARSPVVTTQAPPVPEGGAKDSAPQACRPLSPSRVQLSGTLRTEERLGPPGYGETPERDGRLTIYLLVLDEEVDVCAELDGNRSPMRKDVRRVQLTGNVDPNLLRRNVGRRVLVHGSLSHRSWGTDFTDVVLLAESLRLLEPKPARAA